MATLNRVQIFPSIGIARMGNSPERYLGPELPYPAPVDLPPGDTYKDEQCRIKHQDQRFRLWGFYSDGTDRELTLADGDIQWTVHLVNSKGKVTGDDVIDSGVQTLHGAAASASFSGTFAGTNVPLGQAETDGEGRLIVSGGYGNSANPTDPSSLPSFPTTPGWHDDVSDGPITAQITIGGTPFQALNGAWVICPPPRYAPTSYSITSLYDTLRQTAIDHGLLPAPGTPSFVNDVYPILQRALGMRYLTAFTFSPGDHDSLTVFAPPGGAGDTLAHRQAVVARVNPPGNMPLLSGSSVMKSFQHTFLQQWSTGTVTSDWPPTPPVDITPDGLTRAALENCVGAAFFPGIEAGGIARSTPVVVKQITDLAFVEPFRLDQTQVSAGDVTLGMARPWQGDFMLCTGPESQTAVDSDVTSWWPAGRPVSIYPVDDATNKRPWVQGVASSMMDMVNNWHELGFIVDTGLGYPVETEKTNVCKGCFIIVAQNEISSDEAQALITASQTIQDAFYVVVEGLAPSALGITTATPTPAQVAAWAPTITLSANATGVTEAPDPQGLTLENNANLTQVQRVTFGYNVGFTSTAAFVAEDVTIEVDASIAGLSSRGFIDLTTRQHVYMVHGPTSWLSEDTRVFTLQPGGQFANKTLGTDPNGFIKSVIDSLRTVGAPQANAWFDALPADENTSQLEWLPTLNNSPVFNFALCRVRYRATMHPSGDFRVFFRLFPAMTTNTDYQPATTYRSGGQPGIKIPLLGIVGGEVVTIPFFAENRVGANVSLNQQQDPKNIDSIQPDPGGHETYSYFGCWLDINQPTDKRFPIQPLPLDGGPFTGPSPLQSIADLIRGVHQCLVTEVSMDLDAIPTGATTASSDLLSQRNLSIDHSDNPGTTDTHRVQHPFSIRPTTTTPARTQGPDELMIDWNHTPIGTIATLYVPGINATEVIQLADRQYVHHHLRAVDPSSVQFDVTGGVTYVPIPSSGAGDLAGLLTLDLPPRVRRGQLFRVVVHQVVDTVRLPRRDAGVRGRAAPEAVARPPIKARHILGAFQFSVLVRTREEILPIVERDLTSVQRMFGTIPLENRWYPVEQRYLKQLEGRVVALGGGKDGHREGGTFEGKVGGLLFDAFGDFSGFLLRTEDEEHRFQSRERGIEAVVRRAWRERYTILVTVERGEPHEPVEITYLRPASERDEEEHS